MVKPVRAAVVDVDPVEAAFDAAEWREGTPYDVEQDALVRSAQANPAPRLFHDEVMRRARKHFGVE